MLAKKNKHMIFKRKFYKPIITIGIITTLGQWILPQPTIAANLNYWEIATSSNSLVFNIQENKLDFIKNPNKKENTEFVDIVETKEIEPELTPKEKMRAWVLAEVQKAGLNPKEVDAIINCESRWDDKAVGYNRNGSNDKGLWQINSVHKLSDAERLDYKTATRWAIQKRLRDGNWSAWYCARKLAIK